MIKTKGQIDYILALVVLFLVVFGIVMIASIGVPKSIALTKPASVAFPVCGVDGVDCYFLLKRHLARVAIAFIVFLGVVRMSIDTWRRLATIGFVVTLFTLIYVLVEKISFSTFATRWIVVFGTSVQPVEFAKIGLIIYLAKWLENKGKDVEDFNRGLMPFCIIVGVMVGALALQPDFGSAATFAIFSVGMFFLAGAKTKHLAIGALITLLLLAIIVPSMDYLRNRFISYINPSAETCIVTDGGIVRDYCWQVQQARIAVSSGGFFGRGLTKGVQKAYWLPQASDDFIFAASAEELGFLRSMLVVLAFMVIFYRGMMIAKNAPDRFSMFVATGITLWLTGQAFFNIGVNIGLLPVTGITLPFISYGGSSILANAIGIGILLNISRYSNFNNAPSFNRRRNSRSYTAKLSNN